MRVLRLYEIIISFLIWSYNAFAIIFCVKMLEICWWLLGIHAWRGRICYKKLSLIYHVMWRFFWCIRNYFFRAKSSDEDIFTISTPKKSMIIFLFNLFDCCCCVLSRKSVFLIQTDSQLQENWNICIDSGFSWLSFLVKQKCILLYTTPHVINMPLSMAVSIYYNTLQFKPSNA